MRLLLGKIDGWSQFQRIFDIFSQQTKPCDIAQTLQQTGLNTGDQNRNYFPMEGLNSQVSDLTKGKKKASVRAEYYLQETMLSFGKQKANSA